MDFPNYDLYKIIALIYRSPKKDINGSLIDSPGGKFEAE
jgi:hypothetical protein